MPFSIKAPRHPVRLASFFPGAQFFFEARPMLLLLNEFRSRGDLLRELCLEYCDWRKAATSQKEPVSGVE